MATLIPYIYSYDARRQAEFYAQALKGEIVSIRTFADMPNAKDHMKDKVMHLVLQAAGLTFFMSDSGPVQRGDGMDLTLVFDTEEEARQAFEGLAAGGQVLMPFEKMFWGTMFGRLTDPFGVRWQVSTKD
ncbi:VOC family protein [Paenibacillus thalictri]|uniref:VOC family protein n=1 Tax=Paenibacillus thalictri TaxID=2527873 RepID=A0A4Q9DGM2_9BACL|nr:VOC family protein [Paenibacillus thalictri]TBL71457.1 VOC family protein [Paenibacillus thalictri]